MFATEFSGKSTMSDRTLTHLGYGIKKSSLQPYELSVLRRELTVSPKLGGKFAKQGDSFSVFLETAGRMYLPRMWAKEKYGEAQESTLVDGDPIRSDLVFVGKP